MFEAKKRYGLCVLNYIVTSNHIHLLVCDRGDGEIARSMQLIAGRTGQEYNRRKGRKGAYWEDRYHATAVDSEDYLAHCLVYIDLNMVRAGVVAHPSEWHACGYREIQDLPRRYRIIGVSTLMDLLGINDLLRLQQRRAQWVNEALHADLREGECRWSESVAVGSRNFIEGVKAELGSRGRYRAVVDEGGFYRLGEPTSVYGPHFESEIVTLGSERAVTPD